MAGDLHTASECMKKKEIQCHGIIQFRIGLLCKLSVRGKFHSLQ